MALTLTIGGADFLPQYKTGSAKISERVGNKSNTLQLQIIKKVGQSVPQEGKEIIFKDGTRFLFGGFISKVKPVEWGEGEFFIYNVEATDYTYVFVNKQAQKNYQNQTLKQIAENLISTYVDAGYGLTTTNIATGVTINTITFNHVSLRKAFEKLAKATGYIWWIDYQKNVYFVAKTQESAPESITDSSNNFSNISIECDTSQVRNDIVVRGGREETTSSFQQVIIADGSAREWLLREKPKTMVSLEVDIGAGYVTKTIGVDPLDDETGYDYMFNYQEKYVRASSGTTTPANLVKIRVTYKYEVPIITKIKNATSISAMKALEGGDGIHGYSIYDTSIKSKEEARERALKEIDEFGNPLILGTFFTRSGLLASASSIFKAGQSLTVNLPTWGINTDTQYVIQEVAVSLTEHPSGIEYHYKVVFGGRLLGVKEFLHGLAAQEKVILDTEEVDRIEAVHESITIAETITKLTPRSVSEALSIVETITRNNVTPPWKWEPEGTQPVNTRWHSFEWS